MTSFICQSIMCLLELSRSLWRTHAAHRAVLQNSSHQSKAGVLASTHRFCGLHKHASQCSHGNNALYAHEPTRRTPDIPQIQLGSQTGSQELRSQPLCCWTDRVAVSTLALRCWLMCRMNNDPLSPILDQLYPGARVHHGFLDQFSAVTDKAANASENIRRASWLSEVLVPAEGP